MFTAVSYQKRPACKWPQTTKITFAILKKNANFNGLNDSQFEGMFRWMKITKHGFADTVAC